MEFLAGIFSSVPILVVAGVIVLVFITILILTKTVFKVGNVSITPGNDTPIKTKHEDCNLYNEHIDQVEEAFLAGIDYKELEEPVHKRLRKIIGYKVISVCQDFAYEGYHQVFHELNGRDTNLVDTSDYQPIKDVILKLQEHMEEYAWEIIEENHIIDKIDNGLWQNYRNLRIQESLSNVTNYMINKVASLKFITDREKVKDWYDKNSNIFISTNIQFWDEDIVPLLRELDKNQKEIRANYIKE